MAYDDARKPPKLCPSNIILSNRISRLHSSTEFTNCRSATRASELNFGRELRPKPEEGKTNFHAHFLLCYKPLGTRPTCSLSLSFTPDKGTMVAQWLRCCATNQKVAGSIPAGVNGIFH